MLKPRLALKFVLEESAREGKRYSTHDSLKVCGDVLQNSLNICTRFWRTLKSYRSPHSKSSIPEDSDGEVIMLIRVAVERIDGREERCGISACGRNREALLFSRLHSEE